MITSFKCKDTEKLFNLTPVKRFKAFERQAMRRLVILDAAHKLDDLKIPPGNRLEQLKSDRAGQHSIRINDQWRICFVWSSDDDVRDVEIVDYH